MKATKRTTQPLEWDIAIELVDRLIVDGSYKWALFVTLGIFSGYRISDILARRNRELLPQRFSDLNLQAFHLLCRQHPEPQDGEFVFVEQFQHPGGDLVGIDCDGQFA